MPKLSADDEEFMFEAMDAFDNWAEKKFVKGQREHGGSIKDLTALALVDNSIDECIDEFFYLYTLRQKLLEK